MSTRRESGPKGEQNGHVNAKMLSVNNGWN